MTDRVSDYVRELSTGPFGRLTAALGRATPEERATILDGLTLLRKLMA